MYITRSLSRPWKIYCSAPNSQITIFSVHQASNMCWWQVCMYECGCDSRPLCTSNCQGPLQLPSRFISTSAGAQSNCPNAQIDYLRNPACCSKVCCELIVLREMKAEKPDTTILEVDRIFNLAFAFPDGSIESELRAEHRRCVTLRNIAHVRGGIHWGAAP